MRPIHPDLAMELDSWELHLRGEQKSPKTITTYRSAAEELAAHLTGQGVTRWEDVTAAHVSAWLADLAGRMKAVSANNLYRGVQQLFNWLVAEPQCILARHPLAGMKPPKPDEIPPPVVTLEQVRALMRNLQGREFNALRDNAVFRLFLDSGVRLAELTALTVDDIDLRGQTALIHGKGDKIRVVPFGARTAQALDRYLRARRRHRYADSPQLWLAGRGGPLTHDGVYQLVKRRGREAGIVGLRPHRMRHTFAHEWLNAGGSESDLMKLMGWDSPQMLRRYGASLAEERARRAHREKKLGDRY